MKEIKQIEVGPTGRFYAHYESERTQEGYKYVGTYPLGKDIEIVKDLVENHGYKLPL